MKKYYVSVSLASGALVLSEIEGILLLKEEQRTASKALLRGKDFFFFLRNF